MKNPLKIPIPVFEQKVAQLYIRRAKIDKIIAEYEAEIERRKALPDDVDEIDAH